VILYECLTGARTFEGDNVYAILKAVGDARFAPPRSLRPELPVALEAIVLRAMARNFVARFPSLRALAAALMPFASDRTRSAWGAAFAPGVDHGHADTQLEAVSAPPPQPRDEPSDTLVDAAHAHDSITTPQDRSPRRKPWKVGATVLVVAVLAACLLCVGRAMNPTASPARQPAAAPVAAIQPPTSASVAPVALNVSDAASPPLPRALVPAALTEPAAVAQPPPPARDGRRPRGRPRLPALGVGPGATRSTVPDLPP
jgi:eukaryotic-like serine/threonine-protein kinase